MRKDWPNFTILMVASLLMFSGCAKDRGSLASGPKSFASRTMDKLALRKKKKSIGEGTMFNSSFDRNQLLGKSMGNEPNRFHRAVAGVTESKVARNVSASVKRGTSKVAKSFKPKPKETVDALSLSNTPNHVDANFHLSLARHLGHTGQHASAERQYQQALEVESDNLGALMGYAHLLDRQERLEEAVELYRKAATKHPGETAVFNDLGLCYARQSKLVESLEALEKAVALQPDRKLYRNNVATVLVELDRRDAALSHLQSVHGPAVAQYNLAYLLHEKGDTRGAVDHFSSALAADPNLTEAKEWLQRIEHKHPGSVNIQPAPKVAAHSRPVPSQPNTNYPDPAAEMSRSQETTLAPQPELPPMPTVRSSGNTRAWEQRPLGNPIQQRPVGPVDTSLPLQPNERALWPDNGLPSAGAAPGQSRPVPSDLGAAAYQLRSDSAVVPTSVSSLPRPIHRGELLSPIMPVKAGGYTLEYGTR